MPAACLASDLNAFAFDQPSSIRMDVLKDHVRVVGCGLWRPSEVDYHFEVLEGAVSTMREAKGRARILVDLRKAAVQPAETAARVMHWTRRIYLEPDRVAVVVGSSLLKSQMRRVAVAAQRELFLSLSAAQTWLLA